jgi:hypothetical protein
VGLDWLNWISVNTINWFAIVTCYFPQLIWIHFRWKKKSTFSHHP